MLKPAEVAHVARLARLALEPEEMELMRLQLSSVLGHIDQLNALDTSAVAPTAGVLDLRDVLREDSSRPALAKADVLANAPAVAEGCFVVPGVLGTES